MLPKQRLYGFSQVRDEEPRRTAATDLAFHTASLLRGKRF